jgi:hypothetical protein
MVAESANGDYRLLFPDQGKQTSIFRGFFCPSTHIYVYWNGSTYIYIYTYISIYIYIYFYIYIYIYIYAAVSNGKQKPRLFSLNCLPFSHRANRRFSFVGLFTKKQTEVIHSQTEKIELNGLSDLNRLAHLCVWCAVNSYFNAWIIDSMYCNSLNSTKYN